jgi:hypothetical protein
MNNLIPVTDTSFYTRMEQSAPASPSIICQKSSSNDILEHAGGRRNFPPPAIALEVTKKQHQQPDKQPPVSTPISIMPGKHRDRFFLQVSCLFQVLSQSGHHKLRKQAKGALQLAVQRNRAGDPNFTPLIESTTRVLKFVVGNEYWLQAETLMRTKLAARVLAAAQRRQRPKRRSTLDLLASISQQGPQANSSVMINHAPSQLFASKQVVNPVMGQLLLFNQQQQNTEEDQSAFRQVNAMLKQAVLVAAGTRGPFASKGHDQATHAALANQQEQRQQQQPREAEV